MDSGETKTIPFERGLLVEGLPAAIILVPDVRPLNPKMALAGMQLSIRRSDDPG